MKALILGAGYGTRLQRGLPGLDEERRRIYAPLIEGRAKPLLSIAGKPLVNYLLEKIERETDIRDVYIVCNNFYYPQFTDWADTLQSRLAVHLVNDGSNTNEERLGVMGDIVHAVQRGGIEDDLFVLAGDTLYDMDFGDLVHSFYEKEHSVIGVYEEKPELLHRRGIVVTNGTGRIVQFLEKPSDPPTNLAAPIAYVLTREVVSQLPEALQEGYIPELNTIEWLVGKRKGNVSTFRFARRWDVGEIKDYIAVDEEFQRMR